MHAGLVAHLDRPDARCGRGGHAPDHPIFGLIGKVAEVEIDQVVVPDTGAPGAPGQNIPDGLVKTPRDEPPLRQIDFSQPRQEIHQSPIRTHDLLKPISMLIRLLA